MTDTSTHWDNIYQNQEHVQVSWHQAQSIISLDWVLEFTSSALSAVKK